ncbi:T9SS type A sorting domain-containing protein [Flavobacterium sp. CHNK8]|uniref:T9SS type A sorting domain-containing protein n=1 Tax=Flavobacterium sp. CHNK8 TaxID=2871165 RepID=UPI001C8D04A4|nr:T9SS type A sorting domain-containing protein [Flavobacterium sp. CHNK8]QZK89214.1 T9SS type A sorting domain-containing protein [Flavobacterium sp. CHNK8]
MKKILLSFFLFTSLSFYAQVANLTNCAGTKIFNLTQNYSLLIGNLNPTQTTVTYHLAAADALSGTNTISNPTSFTIAAAPSNGITSQTIYARINNLGNITTNYFNLIVNTALIPTAIIKQIDCINNGSVTVSATGGTPPYTYSKNGSVFTPNNVFNNLIPGSYSFDVKDAIGCLNIVNTVVTIAQPTPIVITATSTSVNCSGNADGSITVITAGGTIPYKYSLNNGPSQASTVFTGLTVGTHIITVTDSSNCLATATATITEPLALTATTVSSNQSVIVNASGGVSPYSYSLDNGQVFQVNNTFNNLVPGNYVFLTRDNNGCTTQNPIVINTPSPLINGQPKLTIEFKAGQTLADLVVKGQNIKWYLNQNPLAGKTNKTSQVPLPLTTVIVDGTTYYASQTINGIESVQRLAVTVKSSTLGIDELAFKNFSFYPNPVKNVISISNDSIIDEITFISIKGETILTQKPNSLSAEIDLSNLSAGIYFLKVTSDGVKETVKIIKTK